MQSVGALQHADDALKAHRPIVLAAVKSSGAALAHASKRGSAETGKSCSPPSPKTASRSITPTPFCEPIGNSEAGDVFSCLPEKLRGDRAVVLADFEEGSWLLPRVDKKLSDDPTFRCESPARVEAMLKMSLKDAISAAIARD